jgi:hypothetical protein
MSREFLVWHDARLLGGRLVGIEEAGRGIVASLDVAVGDFYAGASAGGDGWLRDLRESLWVIELPFSTPVRARQGLLLLQKWRREGALVEARFRFAEQEMELRAPGRRERLVVRMSARDQDMPASAG